jgi:phosphoribosyl-ATP pyrophosphohydrolase/phosphoribosyl-AMP cyclohydrolase
MRFLKMEKFIKDIKFDEKGLVPAVVQDINTKKVLMLAYMNEDSIKKTVETGLATYYSRSRKELWTKGLTSGNTQKLVKMSYDCDGDTILLEVEQKGVACHTGEYSCFFNEVYKNEEYSEFSLKDLYNQIVDRKNNPVEGSYTNYLFDKGIDKILKKVGEENAEVIIAAKNTDISELQYELSDLVYHAMVLMVERGLSLEDIMEELKKRHK